MSRFVDNSICIFLYFCLSLAAIKAVLADDKAAVISSGSEEKVLRKKLNKVVLAYSGGLDTSVIVPWLRYNSLPCFCLFMMDF